MLLLAFALFIAESKTDQVFYEHSTQLAGSVQVQQLPACEHQPSLHLAVAQGNLAGVMKFLSNGSDIYVTDCNGFSPMHIAVLTGRATFILALLEANFNLNRVFSDGDTILSMAIENSFELAKVLVELGANVNQIFEPTGESYIHRAVARGDFSVTKSLIELGADLKASDRSGDSALKISVRKDKAAVLNLLIARGADITSGYLLHYAVENNSTECLEILLGMGLAVDGKDESGCTPLVLAVRDDAVGMAEILMTFGADIDQRRNDDETLLEYAVRNGSNKSLRMLLRRGLKIPDNDRKLMNEAIIRENIDALDILAEFGQNLSATNENNYNRLHFAADENKPKSIRWLVEHGVDVNSVGYERSTPLHDAVRRNRIASVRTLVELGACLKCRDSGGRTPLDVAKYYGRIDIINYLKGR